MTTIFQKKKKKKPREIAFIHTHSSAIVLFYFILFDFGEGRATPGKKRGFWGQSNLMGRVVERRKINVPRKMTSIGVELKFGQIKVGGFRPITRQKHLVPRLNLRFVAAHMINLFPPPFSFNLLERIVFLTRRIISKFEKKKKINKLEFLQKRVSTCNSYID